MYAGYTPILFGSVAVFPGHVKVLRCVGSLVYAGLVYAGSYTTTLRWVR
jgi:hypothetical protein